MFKKVGFLVGLLLLLGLVSGGAMASQYATIDFEGLPEGATPTQLSSGNGISGTTVPGYVGLTSTGQGPAMIFDSNCSGASCSGGDDDLGVNQGKVLIISEDGDSSNPDDSDWVGMFHFDFSNFGESGSTITIVSLDVADVDGNETGGKVEVDGAFVAVIPVKGDGSLQTVNVGSVVTSSLKVYLAGSGAIDNIRLKIEPPPPPGNEGCTPGFWKNRGLRDSFWTATGYSPDDSYYDVFGVGPDMTLIDALNARGGGEYAFLRHSVAALLNETHPDIHYYYSNVIGMVQNGYWSESLKDDFDSANNLGCYF